MGPKPFDPVEPKKHQKKRAKNATCKQSFILAAQTRLDPTFLFPMWISALSETQNKTSELLPGILQHTKLASLAVRRKYENKLELAANWINYNANFNL